MHLITPSLLLVIMLALLTPVAYPYAARKNMDELSYTCKQKNTYF